MAEQKFDGLKNLTESLKNIFVLIGYIIIAYAGIFYGIPLIKEAMNDKEHPLVLQQIDLPGLKMMRASDELNTARRTLNQKASDVKVDAASESVADYVDSSLKKETKSFWVYVGQFTRPGNWQTKNFNYIGQEQTQITAINNTYKRDAKPVQLAKDDWKLGTIVGLVKKNESLHKLNDTLIDGNNVWALVQ